MRYLMTYDDDKRHSTAQRIQDGIAAYTQRFGHAPNVVAVSVDEPACELVTERKATIQKNNYWFGFTPDAGPQSPQ